MAVGETYNFKLIFELNLNISAETISSSSKENILDIYYKSLVWWSWIDNFVYRQISSRVYATVTWCHWMFLRKKINSKKSSCVSMFKRIFPNWSLVATTWDSSYCWPLHTHYLAGNIHLEHWLTLTDWSHVFSVSQQQLSWEQRWSLWWSLWSGEVITWVTEQNN